MNKKGLKTPLNTFFEAAEIRVDSCKFSNQCVTLKNSKTREDILCRRIIDLPDPKEESHPASDLSNKCNP
jgi:hypothetical protein